jgi:hypothetical protein
MAITTVHDVGEAECSESDASPVPLYLHGFNARRSAMKRVTGIGGIFFKSDDPKNLYAWYEKHLGIEASVDGTGANFGWRDAQSRRLKGKSSPSR